MMHFQHIYLHKGILETLLVLESWTTDYKSMPVFAASSPFPPEFYMKTVKKLSLHHRLLLPTPHVDALWFEISSAPPVAWSDCKNRTRGWNQPPLAFLGGKVNVQPCIMFILSLISFVKESDPFLKKLHLMNELHQPTH